MTTADEFRRAFGEDFFDRQPRTGDVVEHNWHEVCICGHIDRLHAPAIGGAYKVPETRETLDRREDVTWTISTVLTGCVGAMPSRGFEDRTTVRDPETHTSVITINPTCGCAKFRPIVKVDRPNRYFNQRPSTDLHNPARHPFMVGTRAFTTFLNGRKAAQKDESWAAAEFERRFVWIDGARRCEIAKCKSAPVDVFPAFVDRAGTTSELRCSAHRPTFS